MQTRLLLVDDHPLFRQGLAALLGEATDLAIVGEAGDVDDVRALVARVEIDVAIVDMWLLSTSGVAVTKELLALQPHCRVLGLSVVEEPTTVAAMLRAGASGFALKTDPPDQILHAIRETAVGARYLSTKLSHDDIAAALSASDDDTECSGLTKREHEILDLVIRGFSNTEIATRLFIARRTVETHRYRITKKLHAHSVYDMQRAVARSSRNS